MLSYSQSSDSGELRQTYSKSNLKQRGEGGQKNPGGWRDSYIDILFMRYDQRLEISEFIFALLVFKPIRRHLPSPLPLPPSTKKKKRKFEHWLVTVLRLFWRKEINWTYRENRKIGGKVTAFVWEEEVSVDSISVNYQEIRSIHTPALSSHPLERLNLSNLFQPPEVQEIRFPHIPGVSAWRSAA